MWIIWQLDITYNFHFDFLSPCLWFSFLALPIPATVPEVNPWFFWMTSTWPILFQPSISQAGQPLSFGGWPMSSRKNTDFTRPRNERICQIFEICRSRNPDFLSSRFQSHFFFQGKKRCYLSWKLKAFCTWKWMVGILVSLWDFDGFCLFSGVNC